MKKFLLSVLIGALLFTLLACTPQESVYVTYSEFGAAGDGVTDDLGAIIRTHDYANEHGLAVRVDEGARYYLGGKGTATIRTDTDWGNAEFIVDDTAVDPDDRGENLFVVASDKRSHSVELPAGYSLRAGQENVGLTFSEPCLLLPVNDDVREYIRYGKNTNDGTAQQEVLLVDKEGNVDPDTPILKDYGRVTKMTAYPADDRPITVKGRGGR